MQLYLGFLNASMRTNRYSQRLGSSFDFYDAKYDATLNKIVLLVLQPVLKWQWINIIVLERTEFNYAKCWKMYN